MTNPDPVVILSAARTPIGSFQGVYSDLAAHQLGAFAIRGAMERAKLRPEQIDEVFMGCVLQAGQGQAPQAAYLASARLRGASGPGVSSLRAAPYALALQYDVRPAGGRAVAS